MVVEGLKGEKYKAIIHGYLPKDPKYVFTWVNLRINKIEVNSASKRNWRWINTGVDIT